MKRAITIAAMLAAAGLAGAQMFAQLFGQTEWTPLDLGAKLACWFDADDNVTVLDADGNPAGNGMAVQTWQDKSGNAQHATAPAEGNRPIYQTAVKNGRAVVRTDGNDSLYVSSSGGIFRNKAHGYMFVVAKDANPDVGESYHAFVHSWTTASGYVRFSVYGRYSGTDGWAVAGRRLDTDWLAIANTASSDEHVVFFAYADWASGYVRGSLNNGIETSKAYASGDGLSSDTDGIRTEIFTTISRNAPPPGSEIAEVVVVNAAMTDAEVSAVQTYLKNKWGTP